MRLIGISDRGQVVIGNRQGSCSGARGHTRRVWLAKRERARAGLHKQSVGMPVIAAIELENQVAPSKCPCQAQRRHRRFGPRADETHKVDTRKGLFDQLRQIHLGLGWGPVARTARCGILDGGDNAWMSVAGDERAPRSQIVDISIAVGVPDDRAFASSDEAWRSADGTKRPHGRIHSTREVLLRFGEQRLRPGGRRGDAVSHARGPSDRRGTRRQPTPCEPLAGHCSPQRGRPARAASARRPWRST